MLLLLDFYALLLPSSWMKISNRGFDLLTTLCVSFERSCLDWMEKDKGTTMHASARALLPGTTPLACINVGDTCRAPPPAHRCSIPNPSHPDLIGYLRSHRGYGGCMYVRHGVIGSSWSLFRFKEIEIEKENHEDSPMLKTFLCISIIDVGTRHRNICY